jgi:hypothetical protein
MENVDAVKEAVKAADALFGTIDAWLIWNLTGGVNGGISCYCCFEWIKNNAHESQHN